MEETREITRTVLCKCNADENGMDGQSGESGSEEKWRRTSRSSVDIVLSCVVFRGEADGCLIATHSPQIKCRKRNEIQ